MAFVPNPHVPYVGPVRGVSPGVLISVSGRPTPQAKWFAINLQCGASMNPRDDIALHISPRFDGPMSKVVRNSLQGGQWGIEENFGHFPFSPDAPFEILILVDVDMFKIAVNGQHFTEFKHRLPLGRVNTVAVDGDVTLQMIRYEGGDAGIPQDAGFQQQTSAGSYGMPMPTTAPGYGSGSHLPPPAYGAPHNTSGYGTSGLGYSAAPGAGYSAAPGAGYSAPGYSAAPGSGYSAAPGGPPGYSTPPGGHTSYPTQSIPMAVPGGGHSPGGSRRNEYLKIGGAGLGGVALGALGGFAAGRLTYPGHGGMGHGGMMHGKKGKKMKKHSGAMGMGMGQFPHKLKHHKMKHGKMKKHKKGSSSSSSSSSSEEE